jgi:putative transposase
LARKARFVLVDYPLHVVQRGNHGQEVFRDETDFLRYIRCLETHAARYSVGILAYCLMGNHVHLLIVPADVGAPAQMMHDVAGSYCRYFNNKYAEKGHLWESRFYSSVVDSDAYRWTVGLYIEQNPVRAGLALRPEDWRFSSARHHALGESDPLVNQILFDKSDEGEYRRSLSQGPPDIQIEEIRKCTRSNKPIGSGDFLVRLSSLFGISPLRRAGRPRNIPSQ